MTEGIIVALITGAVTLAGTVLTVLIANNKTAYRIERLERQSEKEQEFHDNMNSLITDVSIIKVNQLNLTQEVKKHNEVISRTFALESAVNVLSEKQTVANRRIKDLEEVWKHKS